MGMGIVFLVLIFISILISCFKYINAFENKNKVAAPAPAAPAIQPAAQGLMSSEEDDDLAVIMAVVLEEFGLPMEQVVFQSVVRVQ